MGGACAGRFGRAFYPGVSLSWRGSAHEGPLDCLLPAPWRCGPENLRDGACRFRRFSESRARDADGVRGNRELRRVRAAKKSECDQRQRDLPSEDERKDRLMTKSARSRKARRAEWEAAPGPWSDSEAEMLAATSYVPKKSSRNGALVFSVAVFVATAAAVLVCDLLVEGRISLVGILAALASALVACSSLHIALGWEKVVVLRPGQAEPRGGARLLRHHSHFGTRDHPRRPAHHRHALSVPSAP